MPACEATAYRKPMGLTPGLSGIGHVLVEESDTALAMGSGDVPVLATPRSSRSPSRRASHAVDGALPADKTSVGYEVQLAHLSPTPVGGKVTAEATLESVEGRRLTFRVSVTDARGLVAAGRITRVVVVRDRFIERAQSEHVSDLVVERPRDHAVLTLDRPEKRNALSIALRDEISDALDELAADEAMKCVVFTGAGPVFCAGFDLAEFTRAADDDAFGARAVGVERSLPRHGAALPAPDDRGGQRPRARGRLRPRGAVRSAHRGVDRARSRIPSARSATSSTGRCTTSSAARSRAS